MSSTSLAMHYNQITVCGRVDLVHVEHQHTTAILLTVATGGDPLKVIVVPHRAPLGVQRGDVIWCRGRLCCDPTPQRKALHFIEAAHIEIAKRRSGYEQPEIAGAGGRGPGEIGG